MADKDEFGEFISTEGADEFGEFVSTETEKKKKNHYQAQVNLS